ncbi:MAG: hypothetical protein KAW12_18790 [Candidatus Aminicenantes bacterium]|nr:hypothetical protein [Candidatus Aminicenantes bacterium]
MMNTAQLKDLVVDKIYGINDAEYLKAINKILDMNRSSESVFTVDNKRKALINLAKRQIANGEYISNEELNREEDEWLNE